MSLSSRQTLPRGNHKYAFKNAAFSYWVAFSSHWCSEATRWSPRQCSWRGRLVQCCNSLPSDSWCLLLETQQIHDYFLNVSVCVDVFVSAQLLLWLLPEQVLPRLKNLKKYRTDSHKVYYTYPQSLQGTSYFMPPQSFFETVLCLCDVSQQNLLAFAACTDKNHPRLKIPWI